MASSRCAARPRARPFFQFLNLLRASCCARAAARGPFSIFEFRLLFAPPRAPARSAPVRVRPPVWALGFRVWAAALGASGLGFGFGFGAWACGFGLGAWGLGFGVSGFGLPASGFRRALLAVLLSLRVGGWGCCSPASAGAPLFLFRLVF